MRASFINLARSTVLNQLEAGSIIVRHMKSISIPSLPRSMYGPIKLTHTASQGVIVASIVGSFPYFCDRLLFTWQDRQLLTYERTVERICFQYIAALIVSSRHVFPGCCRKWWYQLKARCWSDRGITNFPFLQNTSVFSMRVFLYFSCWAVALKCLSSSWASAISFTVRG